MRAVAVILAVVATLSVGATSMNSAAAASHRTPKAALEGAAAPSWSPDGKQIVFASVQYALAKNCCGQPPSLDPQRFRIVRKSSRPGGAIHSVLAGRGSCCREIRWAAGRRILLNPDVGLKTVGVQGGKPKPLVFPSCAGEPQPGHKCAAFGFILSPNRGYAAAPVTAGGGYPHYAWGIGLVKVRPDGDAEVLSTPLAAEEHDGRIYDRPLAFSPDGARAQLIFARSSWDGWTGGPVALMAIPVEGGSSAVPLAQSRIPGASLLPNDVQQAQWSPDGRWIAYVEGESLEVVPTTGGVPSVLPTCGNGATWEFSWSATSRSIAYGCYSYDGSKKPGSRWTIKFMTVGPDGSHLTDVLESRPLAFGGGAQWSPDGSRLVFLAHKVGYRTVHVWTVRADGSNLTRIG
jgi:dipeptidyl aminopeptidase/acylaminoacyl peptidase